MDTAQQTPEERTNRAPEGGREQIERVRRQKVRKPFVDPAEEVMNSNPNLSPPIIPNRN